MSSADLQISMNSVWVMVAASLVYFMQAGFACVEAGFTRSKNTGNIVMKNLMDFSVGSLVYWLIGFALMFGAGNLFVGWSGFALTDNFSHLGLSLPLPLFLFFQTVFAGTAATIVSGAMAERTKFSTYLIYSAVVSVLIYPVVGHWIWGGGWLSELGFVDFAGSTVVHSVGGWASLAGVMVVGPRLGKYNEDGSPRTLHGQTSGRPLGVFILWFGWFGFNCGSTLAADGEAIGRIAVTTNLSAAAGSLSAMIFSWSLSGKANVAMTLNGALGGLVGITASTAYVSPLSAVIIGLAAGILVVLTANLLDRVHVDDAVGAVSVHGVCGAFGTVAVGLFEDDGLLTGTGWRLLGVQFLEFSLLSSGPSSAYLLFKALKATVGLRVSVQEEREGLTSRTRAIHIRSSSTTPPLSWLKNEHRKLMNKRWLGRRGRSVQTEDGRRRQGG